MPTTPSGWTVEVTDKADRELRKQHESIQADFALIRAVIQDEGLHEVPPGRIEKLRGGIWELRLTGRNTIARALYLKVVYQRVSGACVY